LVRPRITETTALGVAYLAGLATGFWQNIGEIEHQWQVDKVFEPVTDTAIIRKVISDWRRAVERSKHWYSE
jgi:glycerol kinase